MRPEYDGKTVFSAIFMIHILEIVSKRLFIEEKRKETFFLERIGILIKWLIYCNFFNFFFFFDLYADNANLELKYEDNGTDFHHEKKKLLSKIVSKLIFIESFRRSCFSLERR